MEGISSVVLQVSVLGSVLFNEFINVLESSVSSEGANFQMVPNY